MGEIKPEYGYKVKLNDKAWYRYPDERLTAGEATFVVEDCCATTITSEKADEVVEKFGGRKVRVRLHPDGDRYEVVLKEDK